MTSYYNEVATFHLIPEGSSGHCQCSLGTATHQIVQCQPACSINFLMDIYMHDKMSYIRTSLYHLLAKCIILLWVMLFNRKDETTKLMSLFYAIIMVCTHINATSITSIPLLCNILKML